MIRWRIHTSIGISFCIFLLISFAEQSILITLNKDLRKEHPKCEIICNFFLLQIFFLCRCFQDIKLWTILHENSLLKISIKLWLFTSHLERILVWFLKISPSLYMFFCDFDFSLCVEDKISNKMGDS